MSEGHSVRHARSGCPEPIRFAHGVLAMVATYKSDLKCTFRELNYLRRFPADQMIHEIEFLHRE